jgi:hypothetical protein
MVVKKTAGQGGTRGESAAGGRSRAERIFRSFFESSGSRDRQRGRRGTRSCCCGVSRLPSLPVGRPPVGGPCSRGSHPQCPPTVKRTHQGGRRVTSKNRRAAFDTGVGAGEPESQITPRPCSVESRDALHLFAEPVDEHLAWCVLTGDHLGVLDRVLELRVGAEVFSTSIARLGAVFLFDYVEEGHGHAPNTRRRQPPWQSQRSRLCPRSVFETELASLVLRNRDGC